METPKPSQPITPADCMTRRQFVRQGTGAVAAAATLGRASRAFAEESPPAILGGTPVHAGPWPSWPISGVREEQAVREVLQSTGWYRYAARESTVARFETIWAGATGSRYCQAVSSGTAALITSLGSLGIGPGDEVLVPPYTFIATINSVLLHHALPVFVDSDPATAQIDVDQIESRVTGDTRCILPVHLGGASCDMDRLMQLARRHQLHVVEDACQTHTGQWNGKRLGTFGEAGCFSFQNSKNLTSGEGGALITDQDWVYHRAQAYHNNGNGRLEQDGGFTANGGNFRLTEFQGALLIEQFQRLELQSLRRETSAAYLDQLLSEIEGVTPKKKLPGTTRHGYHLYLFDYDPQTFAGMAKHQFLAALRAEGIPVSGGYSATNKLPWVESFLASRGFQRIYGQKRLQRWREENELPANDRMIETTCWLGQNVLMADQKDVEQIAAAIRRIQKHATKIARG